ncbi:hypothetical protein KOI35_10190 [Actinoplanes bogorensis]|uniref:HTH luxR-type domain-containing protein n=1 Tax=Paractinoplanes bogorensis TaxID=1610840 RepID=A0ABS5YK98_9ACTN|nr:hypothetical protein [Actinoplanes bogorensis]MBU2663857.1 hypothetical protein [Actinoplanes bogorensis]
MRLIGRASVVGRILDSLGTVAVTVVTGPAGIGRSAVLTEIARQVEGPVVRIALTRHDRDEPGAVLARLANAVSRLTPHSFSGEERVEELLAARPGLTVLVDDAHLVDDESRAVLERMVRSTGPRWVLTMRAPVRPGPDLFDDENGTVLRGLVTGRLARIVPLPALTRASTVELTAARLGGARPHASLAGRVQRECRGVPAAVVAALDEWQRSGAVRVLDGHAYFLPAPAGGPSIDWLAGAAEPVRLVAKAAAVLHPTGDRLPALAARAYGLDLATVRSALRQLVTEGVLVPGWRFAVPYWAGAAGRSLAPYERGELARALVEAVWNDGASVPDTVLAEQLMRGGGAAEPVRAAAELERLGLVAIRRDTGVAARRLAAAAEMVPGPPRWTALAGAAGANAAYGDYEAARLGTDRLLGLGSEMSDLDMLEISLIHVAGLWGSRDPAVISGDAFGRTPVHRLIYRAHALTCLGRYAEAYGMLANDFGAWQRDEGREHARIVHATSGAMVGHPEHLRELIAHPRPDHRSHLMMIRMVTRTLLMLGDTVGAERLLRGERLALDQLPAQDRVLLTWQSGRWDEAMHHVRMALAGPDPDVPHGFMALLLGRGRLTAARQAVADARTDFCPMPHLLDAIDAMIAQILGDHELAARHVREGLMRAAERGTVAGTEELLLLSAQLAPSAGHAAAEAAADNAARQQTDRSRLLALLTRLSVEPTPELGAEAVAVARRLEQPWMLSVALATVVETGGDPALLPEAYEALNGLEALLDRYRLRGLMRRHNIPVPQRAVTVSENDRLLATLVADGASNRELATVLMTSARSVEGMLGRLFTRTGYRSRVDLAAAVLTGEFPTT